MQLTWLFYLQTFQGKTHILREWSPIENYDLSKQGSHCITNSWSRVLPEKLTGPQLVKIFPAFYRNRKFITAFTTPRHLSLSWARSILSMPPSHFSKIILILSSHLRLDLPNDLLSSSSPTKTHMRLASPRTCYIPCLSHSS